LQLNLSGHPFQRAMFIQDVLFCFLSTIPRATIQGALGSVPVAQGFFQHSQHRHRVEDFIFTAARLYIFCTSICGMLLLNHFGAKICTATAERPPWGSSNNDEQAEPLDSTPEPLQSRSKEVIAAIATLAKEYDVDPQTVTDIVGQAMVALEHNPSNSESDIEGDNAIEVPRSHSVNRSLALAQFECTGTLLNELRQQNKEAVDGRPRTPSSVNGRSRVSSDVSRKSRTNSFGWL